MDRQSCFGTVCRPWIVPQISSSPGLNLQKESNKMRDLWRKKRQIMIHILPRAIHHCSAEGKSDITAGIKHHHLIFIKIFPACLIVWVCVYLLQSWQYAAMWPLWRNPKPTPLQSRQTPGLPEYRSLLWRLRQLKGKTSHPEQNKAASAFTSKMVLNSTFWVWFEQPFLCC